ncbi:ClbS/DfsB family four-helix bundle protein [Pedobacter caeni]|uniref:ClbS/DfsB family four-helix bundle protein n=1 Tax=Pedobacter caeni TaxID=288992 RepID=A0A1M5AZ78_9SPHI|nr:ClbS/DfsB family four-helix bundle protein [Pedobacter caeni]SHF35525.1 hypothetical protein SAMN04488522_102951 [Pedobacter caeni]
MAVPNHKEELLTAIRTTYQKLKGELENISEEQAQRAELEGHAKGTKMTVVNLLSYLCGWAELVLKWEERKREGLPVDFPESGYKWNELGKLAQKFYADYEGHSLENISVKLDLAVQRMLSMIAEKSNDELYSEAWYEKWTLGRMIQFNTSSPYVNARGRIRKWKKELR